MVAIGGQNAIALRQALACRYVFAVTTPRTVSDVVLIAEGVPRLRSIALSAGRQDLRRPRMVGRLGARREDCDKLRNSQAAILSFELLFESMLSLRTEGSVVDRVLPGSHG
jgi:hypothetical protein